MRPVLTRVISVVVTASLVLTSGADASIWTDATGNHFWHSSGNWEGGLIPNGVGAVADFSTRDIVANGIVELTANTTAGTLLFGDTVPSHNWNLNARNPFILTLDVTAGQPIVDVLNQSVTFRTTVAGNEGLTKAGSGTLVFTRANTYTGRTTVRSGTLTLDFSNLFAPTSDIVSSATELRLGSLVIAASGGTLEVIGAPGASNSQTFSAGTTLNFGQNTIRVNQNSAANIDLLLGPFDRDVGSVLNLILPTTGSIRAQSATIPNNNGILGAWATIGSGATTTWAANDAAGNIVPYTAFTEVTGAPTIANGPTTNVRWSGSTGNATVGAGTTDINTLMFTDSARRAVTIPSGSTLRMGMSGGIFKTDTTMGEAVSLLTIGGAGSVLTAGGAPNSVGELILNANSNAPDQNGIIVNSTITDNGVAPVTLIKSGNAAALLTAANSYTGGTYITSGRRSLISIATGGRVFLEENLSGGPKT